MLVHHLHESRRYLGLEVHVAAGYWVYEPQSACVQGQSVYRAGLCAIFAVASYWMPHFLHVYAYLVLSSGVKRHFQQRIPVASFDHAPAGDGQLPKLGDTVSIPGRKRP